VSTFSVASFVLVVTTFGSDFASATAYALSDTAEIEEQQTVPAENEGGTWSDIIEETNEEGTPADSATVADTEETQPAADAQVVDGSTEEVQDPDQPPVDETDLDDESGDDEPDEDADAATDEDETPAEEIEEKLVTVTYKAGKGGKVSFTKETINVNNPEEAFAGSTATANEHYQFFAWVDEDEKPVCTEPTFVPSDVTEDATFTATFVADENIEELMPLLEVKDKKVGDFIVSVEAEVGVFPAGTTVEISQIADSLAEKMAQDALGGESEKQAKGVDITFKDADGIEIQPNDNRFVHVSLKLDQTETVEGESFTVLHEHEGEVKEIKASVSAEDANNDPSDATKAATEVTFDANQFSIFIVVGEHDDNNNNRVVATYKFFGKAKGSDNNTAIFTKLVKKDDVISNPGIPVIEDNQVFDGWYIDGEVKDANKITFNEDEEYVVPTVESEDVVEIYPNIISTYYVTFFGLKNEVSHVEKIVVKSGEEPVIDSKAAHSVTPSSDKAFIGWATEKNGTTVVKDGGKENYVDARLHKYLYPITIDAYWVRFEGNGSGATFTGPQYLLKNEKLSKIQSACTGAKAPTREGYTFDGWAVKNGDSFTKLTNTDWNKAIQNLAPTGTTELYLYATWKADPNSIYTVVFWRQKITDSYDTAEDDREYDYWDSYVLNGATGTTLSENLINSNLSDKTNRAIRTMNGRVEKGFHYLRYEIVDTQNNAVTDITPKGNTIVNVYYDRDVITLTFYKYGQGEVRYEISNTDYEGYTYYGLDGDEYKELERITTHTDAYWTYQQNGQTKTHRNNEKFYYKYGSWYYEISSDYVEYYYYYGYTIYHKTNPNGWDNNDNNFTALTYHEASTTTTGWRIKGTNTQYTGDRYIKNNGTQNQWNVAHELKGLYGQTLSDVKQDWPTEADWYENGNYNGSVDGEHTTFIDAFLNEDTYYGTAVATGDMTINHYKESTDGKYADPSTNNSTYKSGVKQTFKLTNKYNGFSLYQYAATDAKSIGEVKDTEWKTATQDQVIDLYYGHNTWGGFSLDGNYNLFVRYKRNSYKLTFVDVDPTDGTSDNANPCAEYSVLYEGALAGYADQKPTGHSHEGYTFAGWYEDKTCTKPFSFSTKMAAANKIVYAKWEPAKYNVNVDLNGGQVVEGSQFADSTLNADGTRSFNVAMTEPVVKENLDNGVYKSGWELVGWYYRNEDGSASDRVFPFGLIREKVEIIAKWRYSDAIKVIYDAGEHGTYDSMTVEGDTAKHKFTDGYSYSSESAVVVAAKPDAVETGWTFLGWNVNGTVLYPNNTFEIVDGMIDETTKTVTITAVYKEVGPGGENEKTAVTFLPNGGSLKADASIPTEFKVADGGYKREELLVNQKFNALGAIYEMEGYVQTSWNTLANGQGLSVPLGEEIAADNINRTDPENPKANKLYAIYSPVTLYVVVEGSDAGQVTYDGQAHTNKVFSIKSVTAKDSHGNTLPIRVNFTENNLVYSGEAAGGTNAGKYSKDIDATKFSKQNTPYRNVVVSVDSTNNQFKIEITKATLTVKTSSADKEYDGTPLTSEGATITGFVSDNESATVKASGTITEVGTASNTYDASSIVWGANTNKDNYTLTNELGTLTITENTAEVKLTAASDSKTYDGTKLENSTVTPSGLPKGFTVEATAAPEKDVINVADSAEGNNKVKSGYVIKNAAGEDRTASFTNVTPVAGTLTINKAPLTAKTGSATKAYDGTPLTNKNGDVKIEGLVNNETATVEGTGSITDVGNAPNTVSITWGTANENNYAVTKTPGTLTVTKSDVQVTLTAGSDSKTYDGTALTKNLITIGGISTEIFEVKGTVTGSQTDVGSSANVVNDGYQIWNKKENKNVTDNFTKVEKVNGTLTVTAFAITVTTGSDSKQYDGTPLTKDEASVAATATTTTVSDKVQAEIAALNQNISATGSQTDVGSSSNTYSIDWTTAGVTAANYTITPNLGTLTVEQSEIAITLTAGSDSKTYDGTALTKDSVTKSDNFPSALTLEAIVEGSRTDAGTADNVIKSYKILDSTGKDVKGNFTKITVEKGTLTVNPAPITVSTGSDSKEYDGTPLTKDEASISGLVNGETATATATGTITEVGSEPNTYSIAWGTAKAANYDITDNLGTLTITENDNEVKLTAPSDEKTYDGTELTCDGTGEKKVTATGLPSGFTVEATATGSATNVEDEGKNVVNDGYVIRDANGKDKTANFTNVGKVDGKLTINPRKITIVTTKGDKEYDGTPLTKGATVTVEGKDAVTIADNHNHAVTTIALVGNETASFKVTGSQTEVATSNNTYTLDFGNYKASNYDVDETINTLEVKKSSSKVTLTAPSDEKTYDGTALTCDGKGEKKVTATGLPDDFTIEATATGSATNVGDEGKNVVDDGFVIKDANGKDKTSNFTNVDKVDGKLTINPRKITIVTTKGDKEYDGTPLTKGAIVTVEGKDAVTIADNHNHAVTTIALVGNETASFKVTGSQTEVATSNNTYTLDFGNYKASNYDVDETINTLEVKKSSSKVTLTAPSDEKTYDGTALTCDGKGEKKVTATGLPDDFTIEATATGSATNVGDEGKNVVDDGFVIKDANGKDKTSNFTNVDKVDGKLTINPRTIEITTKPGTKKYDGTALTMGATVSVEGNKPVDIVDNHGNVAKSIALVNDETATFTITGTQTEVGSSDNAYTLDLGKYAKNYDVREISVGKLTVVINDETLVTLTAPSDGKIYDGTALTCDGTGEKKVIATGLPDDFTVEATATGSATNAWDEGKNVVDDNYVIRDANGKDQTANFTNVKKVDGKLTISPRKITIVTKEGEKEYDGTPLTKGATVTVEGQETVTIADDHNHAVTTIALVGNETASFKVTGSQTEVATSDNTYEIDFGNYASDNYDVSETINTLKVTETDDLVTLIAPSDSKTYDGTALTCDGTGDKKVTATGLPSGFTVEATATGSITNVNPDAKDNNVVNDGYVIRDAAGEDKTANFTNIEKEAGTLTINPRKITIVTKEGEKEYDGTPLTKGATVTVEGQEAVTIADDHNHAVTTIALVGNETASFKVTGSQTEVATSDNTYEIDFGNYEAGNYDVSETINTLKVTETDDLVTLIAPSDSKTYDGTALTCDGTGDKKVTATGLPSGFTVEATATGSITNVNPDAKDNNVVNDGYVIRDAAGEDKTANFTNIEKEAGTLTINPRKITIVTKEGTKEYDSTPLTMGATVQVEGKPEVVIADNHKHAVTTIALVGNETASFKVTGSQTEVATSDNTYELDFGRFSEDNYDVSFTIKKLTVTATDDEVTLTAPSDSKTYDGTALTCDGTGDKKVTATGLPKGFTVEATATGSITNVDPNAKDNNVVNDGYVIKDANGKDQTSSYTNVKKVAGTLTINPRTITVKTNGGEKEYDGTPLTKGATVTVEGSKPVTIGDDHNNAATTIALVNNETAAFTVTGTQTDVATSVNEYTLDLGNYAGNYTVVTEAKGNLTVTKNTSATVKFIAADAFKTYDGMPLSKDEVKVSGLPEGFSWTATASGEITNQGTEPNVVTSYAILKGTKDVTDQFEHVGTENGTLTVYKRKIEVNTEAGTKKYDGSPLTKGATVTVDGNKPVTIGDNHNNEATTIALVNNETATFTVTGTQTEVNTSKNTYTLDLGNYADNYDVKELSVGDLTVVINDETLVTLTAPSAGKIYDGTALTADGSDKEKPVKADGLPKGFYIEGTAKGSITNAGETANKVDTFTIYNAAGEDRTDNFTNIEKVDGTLTVSKRDITIDTIEGEKEYDGTPLTKGATVRVDGIDGTQVIDDDHENEFFTVNLINNEQIKVKVTGTITEPGTQLNDYTISWSKAKEDNYNIKGAKKNLVVTNNTSEVTVTAPSDEKVYDGKPLRTGKENELVAVEATGLPKNFTAKAVTTGSITNVSETAEGNNPIASGSVVIYDQNGKDKTEFFTNVTPKAGNLTITESPVSITTNGETREYNGRALTKGATIVSAEKTTKVPDDHKNEAVDVTLVNGEKVSFKLTKSQKITGSVNNEYELAWPEGTLASNYKITDEIGVLKVTNRTTPYEILGETDDVDLVYDGLLHKDFDYKLYGKSDSLLEQAAQTVTEFVTNLFSFVSGAMDTTTENTVTFEGEDYTVTGVRVTAERQHAGTESLTLDFSDMVVVDSDGTPVTEQFTANQVKTGTLTIAPAPVKIVTAGQTKTYDGRTLTKGATITVDGNTITIPDDHKNEAVEITLVNNEKVMFTLTESIRSAGSKKNNYTIEWGDTSADDYAIEEEIGTLRVNNPPTPTPDEPTPTPSDTPVTPAAPAGQVLGARREVATEDGAAVLGARRGRTSDETKNAASRLFAIIVSAAVAISLMFKGKKKEDQE